MKLFTLNRNAHILVEPVREGSPAMEPCTLFSYGVAVARRDILGRITVDYVDNIRTARHVCLFRRWCEEHP